MSEKRQQLLQQCIRWTTIHGLHAFSLRTLATDLGTSARMLLYYFESKDALLNEILSQLAGQWLNQASQAVSNGQSPPQVLRSLWQTMILDEHRQTLTLIFEAWLLGIQSRESPFVEFAEVTSARWLSLLESIFADHTSNAKPMAMLTMATFEGLLLYHLTDPIFDVESAFELYLAQYSLS